MATVMLSLIGLAASQEKRAFIQKTRRPAEVQEKFLQALLSVQQNTVLGQQLGLSDLKTVEQFRDRVPVLPYSAYEPLIERVTQGEPNVLVADPVIYLNLTSGSTGKQKLVPVTPRSRKALAKANRVSMGFAVDALQARGRSLGKMLLTSSALTLGKTQAGIPYGPVSVSHLRLTNALYRQVFTHPFEVLKVSDSLARHYICLLFGLANPHLGFIAANFPVLALRMGDYLEQYADEMLWDLEHGTLADWLTLEPQMRSRLESQWNANPCRAVALREILKSEGRLTPKHVWPELAVVLTARGGTSNFYFERFPAYFGNTPIFGGIYSSAEATFGAYHQLDNDSAILAIESGFFEFIPPDQWESPNPKTLLPSEVEPGQQYRILVTNLSGFYRYDIGDVVEVTGFYEQTPLISFRHRRGGLLSSTTEKTTEFHAVQVMNLLQNEFNLPLKDFCITLSSDIIPAHYLVNVELLPGQTLAEPHRFIHRFDARLKEIHVSYAVKRRDQVPAPRLRILESGSFAQLRQRLVQSGIPEAQLKLPHINEDRNFLNGLTVLQEIKMREEQWV